MAMWKDAREAMFARFLRNELDQAQTKRLLDDAASVGAWHIVKAIREPIEDTLACVYSRAAGVPCDKTKWASTEEGK